MKKLRDTLAALAVAACFAATVAGLMVGWVETGPGCPKDPAWLGWCEDIP